MSGLSSNAEWKQWGKDDPLFGVAAWKGKEKGGDSPWTEDEFYALGESDWRDFLGHWRQYGLNTKSCLELGCGAGRITRQLSLTFNRVQAVDVSEHMIAHARKAVGSNVDFSLIDSLNIPQPDSTMSAVFSAHVLQHLDSVDLGMGYFQEFYRMLENGGTLMVHLPLYQFPYERGPYGMLLRASYAGYRQLGNLRATVERRMGLKSMRGTQFPQRHLSVCLAEMGFSNIEFRNFATVSNGDFHPFVFATK